MTETASWLLFLDQLRFPIGILLWITYLFAFLFWISIHGFYFFWRKFPLKFTFGIHFILGFALVYAIYQYRELLIGYDLGWNPYLTVISLVLYAFTIYLELITRRMLKLKTLVGIPELNPDHPESKLLTEGIYAKIRNPRYVLVYINLIGWACLVNYTVVYALIILMFFLIYIAVHLEENELRDRFGEPYIDYCKTVPRFIPHWK